MNKASIVGSALLMLIAFVFSPSGCSRPEPPPYVPPEMSAEELELLQNYSQYKNAIIEAIKRGGSYEQIAVVDRNTTFPESDTVYAKVLVLQREVLDLDDYAMSIPGRETSEDDADYIPGFCTETVIWTDDAGDLLIDDIRKPPGKHMLVEWCVPNGSGDKVSLHYGGAPCLTIDLSESAGE